MDFKKIFKNFFGSSPPNSVGANFNESEDNNTKFLLFATACAVERITEVLCLADYNVYKTGDLDKKNLYYKLNYKPNLKQTKYDFYHDVIDKLIFDGKALIVPLHNGFFVASDFHEEKFDIAESIFKDIHIGDYQLSDSLFESEVIFIRWKDNGMDKLRNLIYNAYGSLMYSAIKSYRRKNGTKAIMEVEGYGSMTEEQIKPYFDSFKSFADSDNALYMHDKSQSVNEFGKNNKESTSNNDINSFIEGAFSFVSTATKIPIEILYPKNKLDKELSKQMLCEQVKAALPIKCVIENAFNVSFFTQNDILLGTKIEIDINKIKRTDPFECSDDLEKLLRIGFYSPDDEKALFGVKEIDEPWAKSYYVTKNYQNMNLKGGE